MGIEHHFSGESLALLACLAAIRLTDGVSAEQAGVLAAFFTTLGDNIALIAAQRAVQESNQA